MGGGGGGRGVTIIGSDRIVNSESVDLDDFSTGFR